MCSNQLFPSVNTQQHLHYDAQQYIIFHAYALQNQVTYATDAVKLGVRGAFITDGRVPHALLNEILAGGGDGMGSGGGGTVVTL